MRIGRRQQRRKEMVSVSVPLSTLTRWFTYDIGLPDKARLGSAFGLTPISAEVEAMEDRDSDIRLRRVAAIGGLIEVYAKLSSKVTMAAMTNDDREDEVLRFHHEAIAQASIVGFLSAFLELGLLRGQYPGAGE